MHALSLLALLVLIGIRPPPPPGATLFPEPVRSGDSLAVVIEWPAASEPGAADTLRILRPGDRVAVRTVRARADHRWIELESQGWVPASALDRSPQPLREDLSPGQEGMAAGRVLPDDWRPSDLVFLPDSVKYPGYEERALRLRAEAAAALVELLAEAAADSVALRAISGWRSAGAQRRLYRRAVQRDPGQRWSAAPGRSEHRLGTTVDVGPPDLPPLDPGLEQHAAGEWLRERAGELGWVISFSRDRHEVRGVVFEPWHLRWVGDRVDDESGW